ncbi:hypothetical protein GCM10011578_082900 [Streptomyces fuscichromogenes]|uniref:SCO1431 family membrane protein n=1 Tax=Streptomyces fuscichromogenes TaxID=1324013 RepID=A0A917XLT7_9ACTN|nr:hypothetical protein GCM10011578_082900 [Streptomyces fuscichromogenes]
MTKLPAAKAAIGGMVDLMTTHSATAARTRTGGPENDGPKVLEHVMGWTLVVVIAMLVTQLGLL